MTEVYLYSPRDLVPVRGSRVVDGMEHSRWKTSGFGKSTWMLLTRCSEGLLCLGLKGSPGIAAAAIASSEIGRRAAAVGN